MDAQVIGLGSRREIEPFSFFFGHASAIPGLGGADRGPDPNYCFHTPYYEYLPGILLFRVTLVGAKASYGELALRIHAFRPKSGLDASLVAGARSPLTGLNGDDLEIIVRVGVVPGVEYALYGYFSEASDLRASGLTVTVEECGGDSPDDFVSSETARSLFESAAIGTHHRLIADEAPRFACPVSQPLTAGQLAAAEYQQSWPELPDDHDGRALRWRQAFALQALQTYGMLREGAAGLLMVGEPLPVAAMVRAQGCSLAEARAVNNAAPIAMDSHPRHAVRTIAPAEIGTMGGQFDFLVAITVPDWFVDKRSFFRFVIGALRLLLRGGVGVFLFDFASDRARQPLELKGASGHVPDRCEIEQLAMRIISHGSDVAQLSFGDGIDVNAPIGEICPFGLIVRR
jgi:hypothetical protein